MSSLDFYRYQAHRWYSGMYAGQTLIHIFKTKAVKGGNSGPGGVENTLNPNT